MGVAVLVYGESGAGKSASMRNFKPDDVGVFNTACKPFPFRGKFSAVYNGDNYEIIRKSMFKNAKNAYVVDDAGYLMTFELFRKVNETGYNKFTQSAKNFYDTVQTAIKETSEDTIVYFIMHCERSDDGERIKAKTSGKMIDNQLTLEGLFSIVLYAKTDGKKHVFETQSDGVTTAKSPMDMFSFEIDNDLAAVDSIIREYYEMKAIDDVQKKKSSGSASVKTVDMIVDGEF